MIGLALGLALVFAGPRPRSLRGWARVVVNQIDWYAFPGSSLIGMYLGRMMLWLLPVSVSYLGGMLAQPAGQPTKLLLSGLVHLAFTAILAFAHFTTIRYTCAAILLRFLDNAMPEG